MLARGPICLRAAFSAHRALHHGLPVLCSSSSSSSRAQWSKALQEGPGLEDFVAGNPHADAPGAEGSAPAPPTRRVRGAPFVRREDQRLPSWFKVPMAAGKDFARIKESVKSLGLATVCEEAKCPNIGECWGGHDGLATATIMVLGDTCTRGCRFCAVKTSANPSPPNPNEPEHVANTVAKWGVDYVVITSVDRDDLPDGGAGHFAECVSRLKQRAPHVLVECLTGDFAGELKYAEVVARSGLNVYAHNVETVERTTPFVRDHRAKYRQSLAVLEHVKTVVNVPTKSSIMLGCGETDAEVMQTLRDLRSAGVDIVTLGQYLQPTRRHMKVQRYVPPAAFDQWRVEGEALGFAYVASGPLVRSSYRAGEFYIKSLLSEGKVPAGNRVLQEQGEEGRKERDHAV